jgi:hypothetical protein
MRHLTFCALTEGTRAVARNMMVEAQEIAERLGVKFPMMWIVASQGGSRWGAPNLDAAGFGSRGVRWKLMPL